MHPRHHVATLATAMPPQPSLSPDGPDWILNSARALPPAGGGGGGLERGERKGVGRVTRSRPFATHRNEPDLKEKTMSFGLNRAELIGRLGADVTVNQLASGGRVANLSIATDESYIDRNGGERVDRTEWHRIVTFQDGLIDMLQKHATKGRLVYVAGKLQTRRWKKDGEDSDRFSTEILLVPGGRVQFLDKPNGNGASVQAGTDMADQAGAAPASASADLDDEIPF